MNCIYLDNNATTPCAPEVVDAMLPFLRVTYGNPASSHVLGRQASAAVAKAREQVAALIGCEASEIVFTGGATESNNLALLGLAEKAKSSRKRILISAVEHKSVSAPCDILATRGFAIEEVPVNHSGLLRLEVLKGRLGEDVLFVSMQAANNEVGTIQPVEEITRYAHACGALVHCDAAQALGKVQFRVDGIGVDLASFSGHKLYGPKGVGALFVRQGLVGSQVAAVLGGGGQELGLRPGTLNVPGIVGMGLSCELAKSRLGEDAVQLGRLRDLFEENLLSALPYARVNGNRTSRLPGTTSVTIKGVPSDALMANVPQVCISDGSACTSGTMAPSHVLLAMGLSRDDAECTIRIGVGRFTTEEDIATAVKLLSSAALALRLKVQ